MLKLVNRKEHLTLEGFIKLLSLKASLNRGLSQSLIDYFPSIEAVTRTLIKIPENINPYWLAGFIEAESCFFSPPGLEIYKTKAFGVGAPPRPPEGGG